MFSGSLGAWMGSMTEQSSEFRMRRRGWIAPLLSTLVTVPMALIATVFVGLSPMACDPCQGAQLERFEDSFDVAINVYWVGLALTASLLFADYVATWQRQDSPRLILAVLAPLSAFCNYLLFAGLLTEPTF